MINFGIDLGTTNSTIARFDKGRVEVFKNPLGLKESLASVVAFRKGRILVGDKAREYLLKAPQDVAGGFKRKMGTTERYEIASIGESKTPIELSSLVLKELKNFVHSGETLEAAVVTIPASFDTIQSNATKKAGELAGFQQVVLLQEPIAASLAYANKDEEDLLKEGQWLVYDLGGGTFDVALVRIHEGEMKVLDHEGDNFLGGGDFDKEIVEKLVVPYLEEEGKFENLLKDMKRASGKYNKLYIRLLYLAEEAKMQLTNSPTAEIEFETIDDQGNDIEGYLVIKREDFEGLLEGFVQKTIDMSRNILERNAIKPADLSYVLMVGGSTYIPYVRSEVEKQLEIPVNTNIDPTTAVAIGAAYFAGSQPLTVEQPQVEQKPHDVRLSVKVAFQKATQDDEEYFTAKFEGEWQTLTYRITRQDGGYDSGTNPVQEQISAYLPLVKDDFNYFDLKVYDVLGNVVETGLGPIGISQGRYSVAGQPLPNDICLEVDDFESGATALEPVFLKNAILPLKKTLTKTITRTIAKGSEDCVTIHVLEGPASALPAANQPIGFISVSGKELHRDLIKGSDIEVVLEMSQSRDLKITAYLMMTDQEFEDVFTPSVRHVSVFRLVQDMEVLVEKLEGEVSEAHELENYETARQLLDIQQELLELTDQVKAMSEDDVTDEKFQIEDRKRKIAQEIDGLTRDKHITKIKMEYFEAKRNLESAMEDYEPTEGDKREFDRWMEKEKEFLATNSKLRIREVINAFESLGWRIRQRNPDYLKAIFFWLVMRRDDFSDAERGEQYISQGEAAIREEQWGKLRICINQLADLLPPIIKQDFIRGGTGIG